MSRTLKAAQPMYEYNLGIRFENVANQHPQKTAIWFSPQLAVSYDELNKVANRIARLLDASYVRPGEVVCLSGKKSLFTFAAMLGCLKIGAAYCVLDPDSPIERLRKILFTCRPRLLIAEHDVLSKLGGISADLEIDLIESDSDQLADAIAGFEDANLPLTRMVTGSSPAYIMFTSGSTGFPKGAVITHASVLNLIEWSRQTFDIRPEDVLTNVNPLYFDNSVFDFYSALFNGSCLVPFTRDEVTDPGCLVERIKAAGCTLWFSVPSLLMFLQTMKATGGEKLGTVRRFVFGGEGYPKSKLKLLFDQYSDSANFFNVYGPTECTCICSCYRITDDDFADLHGVPPLGRLSGNFGFLVLDDEGRKVSAGETGELCLLGPNVGSGYYNDAEQTAKSFVQNPCNAKFPEIMYKTGDLVRLDQVDGKLYIQGRKDNQIKHMGYRVELEEIEAALHCLDDISEAAVLHSSGNGLSRIIAVVAGKNVNEESIRRDLKKIIPEYMIPSAYHREERLPRNPNGKVDRLSLTEKYLQSK